MDKPIRRAEIAHTNLNIFSAIVAILEGGCVYGPGDGTARRTASKIIKLCNEEQARQLRAVDKAHADEETSHGG